MLQFGEILSASRLITGNTNRKWTANQDYNHKFLIYLVEKYFLFHFCYEFQELNIMHLLIILFLFIKLVLVWFLQVHQFGVFLKQWRKRDASLVCTGYYRYWLTLNLFQTRLCPYAHVPSRNSDDVHRSCLSYAGKYEALVQVKFAFFHCDIWISIAESHCRR